MKFETLWYFLRDAIREMLVILLTLERKTGCININIAAAMRSEVPISETVSSSPSVK